MSNKDREALGRIVREVWIEWAREQPSPKGAWLVPWDGLSDPDREVDMRIGERLYAMGVAAASAASTGDSLAALATAARQPVASGLPRGEAVSNEEQREPPALPGEMWRGRDEHDYIVAVALRDGQVWCYTWAPPEFGPMEWWGVCDARYDAVLIACITALCASAERAGREAANWLEDIAAMKARAERAEAQLAAIDSLSEAVWEDGDAATWIYRIRNGEPLDGLPTQEAHEAKYAKGKP